MLGLKRLEGFDGLVTGHSPGGTETPFQSGVKAGSCRRPIISTVRGSNILILEEAISVCSKLKVHVVDAQAGSREHLYGRRRT